jgi:uncharacterized membrane protein YfcA
MDRMTYFYIGCVPIFIIHILIFCKKLRNNKALKIAASVTFPFAVLGVLLKTPEAAMFSGAFAQIISYAGLRFLFKRKYNFEPTYNRMSWYDNEEGRRQNWFDVIVFVIPLILCFIVPLALTIIKAKH